MAPCVDSFLSTPLLIRSNSIFCAHFKAYGTRWGMTKMISNVVSMAFNGSHNIYDVDYLWLLKELIVMEGVGLC